MPTFSIIVPCYNQEQYLQECLDAVVSQSFSDWECIVIDDGSVDGSAAIAQKFTREDARFHYYHQSNRGVSEARNFGISQATGTYLLPLDGDDKIGPDYLKLALQVFEASPDTKLVYCKARLFGAVNEYWNLPRYSYTELLLQNSIFCSAIFRRSDFLTTDGYDTNMKIGYEDWEFLIRFLSPEAKVVQLDSVQFYYRQSQQSRNTFTADAQLHSHALDYMFQKHPEKYYAAIGFCNTFEGCKQFLQEQQKLQRFTKTWSYRTFFKIEREIDRLLKRLR